MNKFIEIKESLVNVSDIVVIKKSETTKEIPTRYIILIGLRILDVPMEFSFMTREERDEKFLSIKEEILN